MGEYDWRQRRDKFRTDFSKENSLNTFSAHGANNGDSSQSAAHQASVRKVVISSAIVLGLILVTGWILIFVSKSSATRFIKVAEQNKHALGLVNLKIETADGKKISFPCGTAWAFSETQFATNGHVAMGLKDILPNFVRLGTTALLNNEAKKNNCKSVEELLKKLGPQKAAALQKVILQKVLNNIKDVQPEIIINGTKKKSYNVTHIQIHKDYGAVGTKFDPDIAVLTIRGKHDCYFRIADKGKLGNLKSGVPVAFLGFPMEELRGDNVNIDNPIASMQSGIIVAVSDFEMKDAGKSGNFLLRHNLPATGGASGSPIFDQDGHVLALLYSGNIIGQIDRSGKIQRAPSAAMINFGVRVDLISGMNDPVTAKEFLGL